METFEMDQADAENETEKTGKLHYIGQVLCFINIVQQSATILDFAIGSALHAR